MCSKMVATFIITSKQVRRGALPKVTPQMRGIFFLRLCRHGSSNLEADCFWRKGALFQDRISGHGSVKNREGS